VLAVLTRTPYAACVLSVGWGLYVLFGLALPTLRSGSTVLGALGVVCAVLVTALGVAGLIRLVRQGRRRRAEAKSGSGPDLR
jgi:hypothetical protein